MMSSHRIAEEKCSLLFTILERSGLKSVVCTILASFPDLLVRHPNTMEPWTKVGLKIFLLDFLKIMQFLGKTFERILLVLRGRPQCNTLTVTLIILRVSLRTTIKPVKVCFCKTEWWMCWNSSKLFEFGYRADCERIGKTERKTGWYRTADSGWGWNYRVGCSGIFRSIWFGRKQFDESTSGHFSQFTFAKHARIGISGNFGIFVRTIPIEGETNRTARWEALF